MLRHRRPTKIRKYGMTARKGEKLRQSMHLIKRAKSEKKELEKTRNALNFFNGSGIHFFL